MCHRGELRLWLGDVHGAVADLDAAPAIAAHTRAGRTSAGRWLAPPRDDPAALEEDARGVAVMGGEGPAAYVHRGEALRRLGRPAEAIPRCGGRWRCTRADRRAADLGLAYAASGEREGLGAVFERLRERCPGLGVGRGAQRSDRGLAGRGRARAGGAAGGRAGARAGAAAG